MGRWSNWEMGTEGLKEVFEKSIAQTGEVRIYTVLNHVSSSGMTRYISAFVPVISYEECYDDKGHVQRFPKQADIVRIARERRVGGCGMDMGFHLAYSMFMSVYGSDEEKSYQQYLRHSWL